MPKTDLTAEVINKFQPFLDEVLAAYEENIDSIHITGSALTADFDPKNSDINSVIVLKNMDLEFLKILAPLGKRFGKKRVAAPLIMTPRYIKESQDVFPIEFFNIKLLHHTIFGEDIFQQLNIENSDLRYQCERELKVKLIGLRQGYISSSGDSKMLTNMFIDSFSGYIPLFRGIILVLGKKPPVRNDDVLTILEEISSLDTGVFKTILKQKKQKTKLAMEQLNTIFEDYYAAIEKLGDIIDDAKE